MAHQLKIFESEEHRTVSNKQLFQFSSRENEEPVEGCRVNGDTDKQELVELQIRCIKIFLRDPRFLKALYTKMR